ncbi:hypothetical protein CAAN1_03S05886 [[Candida] anglica]|uniref:Zn(2)-C6 fungal-type domain-containing protein n=1 Tax=[Candida] anglica TaxID=148631 RepID=A0ABP0EJE3_9ASCO
MSQDEGSSSKRRERVLKACDFCRGRKVKCDGNQPCANCTQNLTECHYKLTPNKRRAVKPKVTQKTKLEFIDDRLSRLEGILSNFVDRFDGKYSSSNKKRQSHHKQKSDDGGSVDDDVTDSCATTDEESSEVEISSSHDTNIKPFNTGSDDKITTKKTKHSLDNNGEIKQESEIATAPDKNKNGENTESEPPFKEPKTEEYFGNHSIVSMFSEKSLSTIQETLGNENANLVDPIRKIPFVFQNISKPALLKWIDPPLLDPRKKRKLFQGIFPEDRKFVDDLLKLYYSDMFLPSFLVPTDHIQHLFDIYYRSRRPTAAASASTVEEAAAADTPPRTRRLKISELLIMSLSLCFCISSKIDCDTRGDGQYGSSSIHKNPNSLKDLSTEKLVKIREEYFDYAVQYYRMISVVSDGVETILAILYLLIYVESNFLTIHVNYILIAVAIRFAQEIGLHRPESYEVLPLEERETRRRLWLACRALDIEICYRSGKPPSISFHDEELFAVPSYGNPSLTGLPFSLSSHENSCVYFMSEFTRLRAVSYHKLLCDSTLNSSLESVVETLSTLNNGLFAITDLMTPETKPRLFYDAQFQTHVFDGRQSKVGPGQWTIKLSFFSHLMLINRIPSMLVMGTQTEETSYFQELSLNSARTVLMLVNDVHRLKLANLVWNWNFFYPIAAFLNLLGNCLCKPESPDLFNDVNLLIEISMEHFATKEQVKNMEDNTYDLRARMMDLTIRLLLRVLICFTDRFSTLRFQETNPKLKLHLDEIETKFPDFFAISSGVVGILPSGFRMTDSFEKYHGKHASSVKENYSCGSVYGSSGIPPSSGSDSGVCGVGLNPQGTASLVDPSTISNADKISKSSSKFNVSPESNNSLPDSGVPEIDELIFDTMFQAQLFGIPNPFFDSSMGL